MRMECNVNLMKIHFMDSCDKFYHVLDSAMCSFHIITPGEHSERLGRTGRQVGYWRVGWRASGRLGVTSS